MQISSLVEVLGSKKVVADMLKITPVAVTQWGETIPEDRVVEIRELMSEGVARVMRSKKWQEKTANQHRGRPPKK